MALPVPAEDAVLVHMLRGLPPRGMLDLEELDDVVLRDAQRHALTLPWSTDSAGRWAIASLALPAGQYALRAPRRALPTKLQPVLEQSLWLPRNGKTLVFASDKDAKSPYKFNIFTAKWQDKR